MLNLYTVEVFSLNKKIFKKWSIHTLSIKLKPTFFKPIIPIPSIKRGHGLNFASNPIQWSFKAKIKKFEKKNKNFKNKQNVRGLLIVKVKKIYYI